MKTTLYTISISILLWFNTWNETFAQRISAGGHSLFFCNDSTAWACGENSAGQLGDTTRTPRKTPVQVYSLSGIISVAAGGFSAGAGGHSLFLKNDGTVWACGSNSFGQLGDSTITFTSTPIQINSLSGIIAISAGRTHSLFLKNDGTVWACGNNTSRQLGDGTTTHRITPVSIGSLSGITAVSAGNDHSIFLKNDGTVWTTWGSSGIPVQISSLSGITAVSAGGFHSLFLKNDGTVWANGSDIYGQLGDGPFNSSGSTPVQVTSLSGITAISAGWVHSLFLKNDGTVWACGNNANGQLGDGTTVDKRLTPVKSGSLSGIIEISAGGIYQSYGHSLFLKNDGTVWACGYNNYGQLGDGTNVNKYTPVQVTGLCSFSAGVNEIPSEDNFLLYPNPFNLQTTLQTTLQLKNATLKLNNTLGQTVSQIENINGQTFTLARNNLPGGLYYLQLLQDNKLIASKKLRITD